MDECLYCSYFYNNECHFIEDEPSLAHAGVDCLITLRELQQDMI